MSSVLHLRPSAEEYLAIEQASPYKSNIWMAQYGQWLDRVSRM